MLKRIASFVLVVGSLVVASVSSAVAAAPDGFGPWADIVVADSQGTTKGGAPVNALRSDPTSALGVAENDTVDSHFFSLGFGGSITLGFDNGISSGAFIVEATNAGYPTETARVEVSQDGTNWYFAGNVSQDGSVSLPREVSCGRFVRITDISNPADFDATADAYDVDGVEADGLSCSTDGRMTGGGSVFTQAGARVTHGFQLRCDATDKPQNLQINWGKNNKFHLESLTSALCTDDPAIDQQNPNAHFDTYTGTGVGRFNGVSGYTAEWVFVDAGEPGVNDIARLVIKSPANVVILTASGLVDKGNHQAHD